MAEDKKLQGRALRNRAIGLLARREYSRAQLHRKLHKSADGEELEALLDVLAEQGLQSDARFTQAWLRTRAPRFGRARLEHDLATHGISAELAAQCWAALASDADADCDLDDEQARAFAVWQKRFGTAAADYKESARQARFLQGRGFASDVVRAVLRQSKEVAQ